MTTWVVAIEYAGPDLELQCPAPRRPLLEHAFDIDTGELAHGGPPLRVGFVHPARGWPAPTQLARCLACTHAVTAGVAGVVSEIVGRTVTEMNRWATRFADLVDNEVWLWSAPLEP